VEHKIESSDGPPNVQLQLVPKMLKPLVFEWAPQAFFVSFKVVGQDFSAVAVNHFNMILFITVNLVCLLCHTAVFLLVENSIFPEIT